MRDVVLAHIRDYNENRYSAPWIAVVKDGLYDFKTRVGYYTGDKEKGSEGDLIIMEPREGLVYAYGQKDRRRRGTYKFFVKWDEAEQKFIYCDMLGRVKKP